MAKRSAEVSEGVYEHVVTQALKEAMASLPPTRVTEQIDLDRADAHVVLARHLSRHRSNEAVIAARMKTSTAPPAPINT